MLTSALTPFWKKTHGDQTPARGYQGEWKPEAAGEETICSQTERYIEVIQSLWVDYSWPDTACSASEQ